MPLNYDNYERTIPYPTKPKEPKQPQLDFKKLTPAQVAEEAAKYQQEYEAYQKALDEYKRQKAAYDAEGAELEARFKRDLIAEVGLAGHPKADKAYYMAQDRGSCRTDTELYLSELAELLLP